MDSDQPVTALNIKLMLNGLPINQPIKKPKHMIMAIFRQHNDEIKALVGSEYSENTLERYKVSYRHTLNFLLYKYQVTDMDINDLNYEFMAAYEFWLKTVRKCDHNGTMKYLANFKKIVIRCIKYGFLTRDPFVAFKLTKREVERIALTEREIQRITNEVFEIASTAIVRDRHRNLKTTQHYAKILDKKIGDDMKGLREKYNK